MRALHRRIGATRRPQALLGAVLAVLAFAAAGQGSDAPLRLTGTLARLRDSGTVTLAYRQSSIPFSYLSGRGEPIGYSIDLCRLLVDAMADAIGRPLAIRWLPVTAESRLSAIASGQADLECGSTSNTLERQKQVAFSPTVFISGTKLLVRKGSPIRSYRDLAGRKVAVTSGTTNEKALRELMARFRLDASLVPAPDHAAGFAMLAAGQVDSFATDDVLLYGLLAQNAAQADYEVTGEFLSYDPYGIVFRKDDAMLARLVRDTFQTLAEDRELERRYERWFMSRLPGSQRGLNLPMSPQLDTVIQSLASHGE